MTRSPAIRPPFGPPSTRCSTTSTALGPVHVDAVKVGVFLKSDRKIAEVRPRVRTRRPHAGAARARSTIRGSPARCGGARRSTYNVIKLTGPSDVDDQVRAWLTEAYGDATD